MIHLRKAMIKRSALALSGCCLMFSMTSYAAGTDRDPLDGTGVANNPTATTVDVFGTCNFFNATASDVEQGGGGFSTGRLGASIGGQGDEGFSIAFGTVFNPDFETCTGTSIEDVDSDPLPNE